MLKISNGSETIYKILAGWSGSYMHGSSWKLNSGCTNVKVEGDYYLFNGYSGSIYKCHKDSYGLTGHTAQILQSFQNNTLNDTVTRLEVMDENTNWMELNYE